MNGRFLILVVVMMTAVDGASAGIFSRRPKASPQRAQELIATLRGDASESKRAAAADELGSYNVLHFPEIVPALLAALNDASASVRLQAVQSIGGLRPVSTEIGESLEHVLANDSSTRVRLQARTILWQYYLAGYRTPKTDPGGPALQTPKEPPLAGPPVAPSPQVQVQPPSFARPMPSAPAGPTLTPVPAPRLEPSPSSVPVEEGPMLIPPQ